MNKPLHLPAYSCVHDTDSKLSNKFFAWLSFASYIPY